MLLNLLQKTQNDRTSEVFSLFVSLLYSYLTLKKYNPY